MTGALILVGTIAAAIVVGLVLRFVNGRIRAAKTGDLPPEIRELLDPAASVTLVQLSTTFCTPCRQTAVLLTDLAGSTDGLHHAELDVTDRPEVAQRLSVLRTPTTIALSRDGSELLRVGGVPQRRTLLEALRPHL